MPPGTIVGDVHRRMQRTGYAGQPWQARLDRASAPTSGAGGSARSSWSSSTSRRPKRAERALLLEEAEKMGGLYGREASERRPHPGRDGRGVPLLPLTRARGDHRPPAPPIGGDRRPDGRRARGERGDRPRARRARRLAPGSADEVEVRGGRVEALAAVIGARSRCPRSGRPIGPAGRCPARR